MPYYAFPMGEVYRADDVLAQWLVTLSLAMNDITLVHTRLDEDQADPAKTFYWNRLAVSHFTEIGLYVADTDRLPEIRVFVDSLSEDARLNYDTCLRAFAEARGRIFRVRNEAAFHYPELRQNDPQVRQPVRDALAHLADERGVIHGGVGVVIREGRALYADDVVSTIFVNAVGGLDAVDGFFALVAEGTTAFIRFTNLALDEHLFRAAQEGASVVLVEPVDPDDLSAGWRTTP